MKILKLVCCSILMITGLYSCMPDYNELWFNKDGSGKIAFRINMEDMEGQMNSIKGMMGEEFTKDMKDQKHVDTIMYFSSAVPDSIKNLLGDVRLLDQVYIRTKVDDDHQFMSFNVDYENEDQLEEIMAMINDVGKLKSGNVDQEGETMLSQMFRGHTAQLDAGVIIVEGLDLSEMFDDPETEEMINEYDSLLMIKESTAYDTLDADQKAEIEFTVGLFDSMLGGEIETVVHAPSKILFSSNMNAEIDGNTIRFRESLWNSLRAKKEIKPTLIKFKK